MRRRTIFLTGGFCLAVAIYAGTVAMVDRSTTVARQEARIVYLTIRDELAAAVSHARERLEELEADPATFAQDSEKCGEPLAAALARYSRIHDVFLRVRPDGMLDCTPAGGGKEIDFSDRLYFMKALQEKTFVVGEFLKGKVSNEPVLAVALPVLGGDGAVTYVLVAGLKTDWLQEVIDKQVPESHLVVEIQDGQGTLLTYFVRGTKHVIGKDARAELIRLPLLPDRSNAEVVIYEQT